MMQPAGSLILLSSDQCQRAARARDPRFDGVFFIGVTSTGIYCRPICPGRFVRPTNRRFFVFYTQLPDDGTGGALRVSSYLASATNPDLAEPASEREVITIAHPGGAHNGGHISFGADGYLYVAAGDGGNEGFVVVARIRKDEWMGLSGAK